MLELGTSVNRGGFISAEDPLLLDTYSGASAAFSLRKLSNTYSGPALQIRRASDNVEVDVSFDTNGVISLDSAVTNVTEETSGSSQGSTTATNLGEFVADAGYTDVDSLGSADSALVQCWYDQSSNSNHATQATAPYQPKIYDGTTGVVTENGKPAVEFDGSGDNFVAASISLTQAATTTTIGKTNDSNVNYFFDGDDVSNRLTQFQNSTSDGFSLFGGSVIASSTKNTNQNLHFVLFNGASSTYHLNGNSIASGNVGSNSADGITIGARYNVDGNELNGNMQELIFWDSDKSSDRTGIESNINTFYSIY
jgi:hypothetical protein